VSKTVHGVQDYPWKSNISECDCGKRGNLQEEVKPAMICLHNAQVGLAQFDGEKLICPLRWRHVCRPFPYLQKNVTSCVWSVMSHTFLYCWNSVFLFDPDTAERQNNQTTSNEKTVKLSYSNQYISDICANSECILTSDWREKTSRTDGKHFNLRPLDSLPPWQGDTQWEK